MLICVALSSDTPKSVQRREEFLAAYARSSGKHTLTDDPEAAEMIVLVGELFSLTEAKENVLHRKYPEKTMTYSEIDAVIPYVSGIYCSAARPKFLNLQRTRSYAYLSRYGSAENKEIRFRGGEPKSFLFCFRGKRNCNVRSRLMDFDFKREDVVVLDTTSYSHWGEGRMDRSQAQREYADTLAQSHFALCPRGAGFGSIRLFEVMEMQIAPVLLADRYALPAGPDWDSFLLRFPEREIHKLPEFLNRYPAESEKRALRARQVWAEFFAREKLFDAIIDQLQQIREERFVPERLYRKFWWAIQLRADFRRKLSATVRRGFAYLTTIGQPVETLEEGE